MKKIMIIIALFCMPACMQGSSSNSCEERFWYALENTSSLDQAVILGLAATNIYVGYKSIQGFYELKKCSAEVDAVIRLVDSLTGMDKIKQFNRDAANLFKRIEERKKAQAILKGSIIVPFKTQEANRQFFQEFIKHSKPAAEKLNRINLARALKPL